MRVLLFVCLFVANCTTTKKSIPTYIKNTTKPITYKSKYTLGECVKFNKEAMRKKGLKTDGTIMFIRGFQEHPVKHTMEYLVLIDHHKMDKPYEFTAVIKVFDADTDKVPCKT